MPQNSVSSPYKESCLLAATDSPGEWPAKNLEYLGKCPVCGNARRSLLLDGLIDVNYRCAPGQWTLWRCSGCDIGYLDPRPTQQSIVRAYETYATHEAKESNDEMRVGLRRLAAMTRNSYLNRKYGTRRTLTHEWAWILMYLLPPPLRLEWDHSMRHLPRPRIGCNRLLDIGCGNGEFLERARDAGWDVVGIDFDPAAVKAARSRGLTVHEGNIHSAHLTRGFDWITSHQVIEHVHNPRDFLEACRGLLRPGGFLWIGTPNLDTPARIRYIRHWAAFDTPRHLTFFTHPSLRALLSSAGFYPPRFRRRGWITAHWMAISSQSQDSECPASATRRTTIGFRELWFEPLAFVHPKWGADFCFISQPRPEK